MGLFDRIKIDDRFNLKLKKADVKTISNVTSNNDWKNSLQTKDLENWMQDFTIDSKGKLWIYEDPKDKRKRKLFTHTGEVDVYTIITSDETDHDVDVNIKVKFTKGIGKVLTSGITKHSNATRIKNEAEFQKNRKRYDKLRETKRYKVYLYLYRNPVNMIFGTMTRMLYKMTSVSQRLRCKLLFW